MNLLDKDLSGTPITGADHNGVKLYRAHHTGADLSVAKSNFEAKLNEESTKSSEKVSENELSGPGM